MTKEIAKSDDTSVPDYLKGTGPVQDNSNFDSSDVVIPMIKLLQGTSPECEIFDNAKAGIYWHTGMDVPLGNEFKFVVAFRKKKYLLTAPMEDGQGVLARADDFKTWDRTGSWEVKFKDRKDKVTWAIDDLDVNKSGLDQWGTSIPDDENSPPAATLFYDYIVYLPDYPDLSPVAFSITRSKIKKAKKGLNDKIALQGNAGRDMEALVFMASTNKETNSNNQPFFNVAFQSSGFVPDEETFKLIKSIGAQFADTDYRVKGEEDATNEGAEKAESNDF